MHRVSNWAAGLSLLAFAAFATHAAETPTDPQGFVKGAMQVALLEVEASRLAQANAASVPVRDFAARSVSEQGKASAELTVIAKAKTIEVPGVMGADREKQLSKLQGRKGKAFDRAYAELMVQDLGTAVELFQANVSHPDGELAAFAARTLPMLQEHKRLAGNLKANLK